MAKNKKTRKPITEWIENNLGLSLAFISKNSKDKIGKKLSPSTVYNFTKGVTRNKNVEKLFLLYGVPQEEIDATFNKKDFIEITGELNK